MGCHFGLPTNLFCLTYLQPTGNAHPWRLRQQDFVLQLAAFEKHTLTTEWGNGLYMVVVVNAQFTTIFRHPLLIEVQDHGKSPAFVAAKLIEVAFVKTAFFIQGVMEFIATNAGITTLVQVKHKAVHQFKKAGFQRVMVLAIQPINLVAPGALILMVHLLIADPGGVELLASVQVDQMGF